MATRAYFGYEKENGEIKYCYNHWDGYIEGLGEELLKVLQEGCYDDKYTQIDAYKAIVDESKNGYSSVYCTNTIVEYKRYDEEGTPKTVLNRDEYVKDYKEEGGYIEYIYLLTNDNDFKYFDDESDSWLYVEDALEEKRKGNGEEEEE